MDKTLSWFVRIWIFVVVMTNFVAAIGMFIAADSLWGGLQKVAQTYSLFNVWNYMMELVLCAPAIGAHLWRERRRREKL